MSKINWKKPIQCLGRYTQEWRDCELMGIAKVGAQASSKYNRVINTTNGFFFFDEDGLWEHANGPNDCHLRNTPTKTKYWVITYKTQHGGIKALAGVADKCPFKVGDLYGENCKIIGVYEGSHESE